MTFSTSPVDSGSSEEEATAPGFLERYRRVCEPMVPLMRFLSRAVGVRF